MLCLGNKRAYGEVFIIGSEEYITLNELVRKIAELLQVRPPKIRIPLPPILVLATLCEKICVPLGLEPPLHRRRVSFFRNHRAFSIEKAKCILQFKPNVSLEEALRRTISWYEDNRLL